MSNQHLKRIFISHAATDKEFAEQVADLLSTGASINLDRDVFCTSLEGLGIPPGLDFKKFIKKQILHPRIVLMLISQNYLKSQFCLAEAGASWALSHRIIPILIPPATFEDLRAVLSGIHAIRIDDPDGWNNVIDILKREMNVKPLFNRWDKNRNRSIALFKSLLQKRSKSTPEPTIQHLLQGYGGFLDRKKRSTISQAFAQSTLRKLDIFAGDLSWLAEDLPAYIKLRKRGVRVRILTDTPNAPPITRGKKLGIEFWAYANREPAPLKASISDSDEETESRAFVVKRFTPRTLEKSGYDYWVKIYHGSEEYTPIKAMECLFEMQVAAGKRL